MNPDELIRWLERRLGWLNQQRETASAAGDLATVDSIDQQVAGCNASLDVLRPRQAG